MQPALNVPRLCAQVLTDPASGTGQDKLRLFLLYFLCSPAVSDAELDQYAGALQVHLTRLQ